MDPYRFYVPDLLAQSAAAGGGGIRLPDDQAHHAKTVLRLTPGTPILLFDGNGAVAHATLADGGGGKKHLPLTATITGGITVNPAPAISLTLVTAVPKGDRAEWLVEQASQLNVARIQWIDCDRSVVKPKEGGAKIEKWRRLAIESAKQCHRTHLLHIEEPIPLQTLLAKLSTQDSAVSTKHSLLWLEPRDDNSSKRLADMLAPTPPPHITALIGPEGGWSSREFQLLEQAAQQNQLTRIRLTDTILRIETANAALAAIVMSAL
jgi:16S rRNA (uracil1498-N3)-methyltransferase